jgi:hypothetical protein
VITPPVYNDASFRAQFPAFASLTAYPQAALQFAWNMGGNWVNQNQPNAPSCIPGYWAAPWCSSFGLSVAQLQQAADLMGAVMTYQLYGPAANGSQTPSQDGEAPGAVQSASEGSVSASFQLPAIGTSAFSSMLLASPPYGRMLLALLQIAASVGPYIRSGRPSYIPP